MSNEVRIGVTGTNTSGAAINTAKRDVKDLGDEAQKSAKRVVELGVAEEGVGSKARGMGRALDDAGDQASQLARKLLEAKAAAKLAADEFNRTGNDKALESFKKARRELSELSSVAKNVKFFDAKSGKNTNLFDSLIGDSAKVGAKAAGTFAQAFEGGLLGTLKALPPEAQAALGASLAGVAIAATPFIVSAVNGAILGGIGAGGLAAGIAAQFQDPAVMGAFQHMLDGVEDGFMKATAPFKPQLLSVATDFSAAWTKILPNVQGFFSDLAPSVSALGEGIAKAVTILGPALEKAAGPAEQVLEAVAQEIPEIAQQIGNLLDDISEHGDSAAAAIKFILLSVEALIAGFDILVQTVGPAADAIVHTAEAIGLMDKPEVVHSLESLNRSAEDLGGTSENTAASVDYMNRSVYNTADAADQANSAFERLFGEMMNLDEANLKVAEDFRELSSALKKSNGDLREGTEAGQRNRGMILGMVQDLEQQREAAIAAGNGTLEATQKANAAYLAQLQKLRAVAAAAGASTAQIDALIGKYQKLANQPDITKHITIINTAIYKTVRDGSGQVVESGRGLSRDRAVGGVVGAAASGGARDGLTWVGEEGPELVSLPPGTSVYTAGASRRMAGGDGGSDGPARVVFGFSGDTDSIGARFVQALFDAGMVRVPKSAVA